MTEVKFFDPFFMPDMKFTYSVIAARYGENWLYVRHHKRDTWEIPGGHVEENETPDDAAGRELIEETGAVDFKIECVATYSVFKNGETGYGRLYFAEIFKIGPVPDISEIAEIKMMESLPDNLTHPDIQPRLYERIIEHIKTRSKS